MCFDYNIGAGCFEDFPLFYLCLPFYGCIFVVFQFFILLWKRV